MPTKLGTRRGRSMLRVPRDGEFCRWAARRALPIIAPMFSARTSWPREPNRLTQAEQATRAFGADVVDLTVSNPTTVNLTYDAQAILGAISNPGALRYEPAAFGPLRGRE